MTNTLSMKLLKKLTINTQSIPDVYGVKNESIKVRIPIKNPDTI